MDFEKKLERLEEIVEKMETGELPLEDSLKLFEEGVKLSRECNVQLSEAEQKVKLLLGLEESGQAITRDFTGQES
jgi:exodeoxyribonuclease VII small subunit